MLELRAISLGDEDKIRRWRNLPHVRENMLTDHEISIEEHKDWFGRVLVDPTSRYWVVTSEGTDVGCANIRGINLEHRHCNWGYYIANTELLGKGLGTILAYKLMCYVFEDMKLHRLFDEAVVYNESIIKLHERLGFTVEGRMRQQIFRRSRYHDTVILGILAEEWLHKKPLIVEFLRVKGLLT